MALGAGLCLCDPGSGHRWHIPLSPRALSWDCSPQLGSVTAALHRGEKPLKADFSACRVTRNGTGGEDTLVLDVQPHQKKRSGQLPPALSMHLQYRNRGKVPVFMAGSWNAEVLVLLSADIDECESRDTCQHECRNSLGSFQCACPSGYRLMPNGKTCQGTESHPCSARGEVCKETTHKPGPGHGSATSLNWLCESQHSKCRVSEVFVFHTLMFHKT